MKHQNHFWLLLAFALRVYALDAPSLWSDEGTSVALASLSVEAIVNGAVRDIHPPLYYLLLHFWMPLVGQSEFAVRFLSVLAGVLVVAVVFRIASSVFDNRVAILAACLAALAPFQVYYSQEARMYIWVTLWAAVSMSAFVRLQVAGFKFQVTTRNSQCTVWLLYITATLALLYTQYVGAFVLVAENLAFAVWLPFTWRSAAVSGQRSAVKRALVLWLAAQLIVAAVFAPWFLAAGGQLASWPPISEPLDLPTLVWRVLNVFSVGITLEGALAASVSLGFGALFLIGLRWTRDARANWGTAALILWTLVPIGAMYVVSLSRPAYNPKFLLLATPPFYILAARGLRQLSIDNYQLTIRSVSFVICIFVILSASILSLTNYYFDPRYARDDYRTIVRTIDANARVGDGILINAPGQIDVVRYYWRGDQTLFLLPRMRPPDPAATRADVDEMLSKVTRLFAIYYATQQSDPHGIVETRLAERAFKARDEWHGNIRLAIYGIAPAARAAPQPLDAKFGNEITLANYQLDARTARAGDVLTLTLNWRVEQTPSARYKVFVHLLDVQSRVVAQRDGEPVGDTRLTTTWRAGENLADNYGVFIEPGTPPGEYRVEIGMYRADDGARLPIARDGRGLGDHLIIGTMQVK